MRELLARYKPEVIRFFILNSHYRSPLNYTNENVDEAKAKLDRLYTALRGVKVDGKVDDSNDYARRFCVAMDDDFNTPDALAVMFEIARELNRAKELEDEKLTVGLASQLKHLGGALGLLQGEPMEYFQVTRSLNVGVDTVIVDEAAEIRRMITQREQARREKNWAESDRIRDELKAKGIILEDGAKGTTWRRE